MTEESRAMCFWEGLRSVSDRTEEFFERPRMVLPHKSFEFRESHLDWVEVRAVGWQVTNAGTGLSDRVFYTGYFVTAQVVANNDVVLLERGCENLAKINQKSLSVHRSFEQLKILFQFLSSLESCFEAV